jgi:H+-translocating NAD(P) transhydrogenase subunit alpha
MTTWQRTFHDGPCITAFAIAAIILCTATAAHAQPGGEYDLSVGDLTEPVVTINPEQDAIVAKPQEEYIKTTEMIRAAETESENATSDLDRLITYLTIFVLAIFVGFEVITKVPPTLHTPLMSGSNAISGITIIGAILAGVSGNLSGREILAGSLAFAAAALAMINVVGGFTVTNRMLQMFRKKDRA